MFSKATSIAKEEKTFTCNKIFPFSNSIDYRYTYIMKNWIKDVLKFKTG